MPMSNLCRLLVVASVAALAASTACPAGAATVAASCAQRTEQTVVHSSGTLLASGGREKSHNVASQIWDW
ncbi:hypothetical protein [Rathayibacter toxicus]|uniref:hypothetical protein n=1 Tax=Rathayibacter toxicus TaxID=145458 RepID=UPI0011AFE477|nr:hypothetical protein [Rathayibacter toxicus]QOD10203.1 hypothetical protein BSG36_09850 [Rathayibacter toxicus]QWL28879.1 hypothetical protein E2R33_09875 [Rathayibacter toxicus]QWL33066.1 hypothetical protein E2R35_09665 [Rathayibacter toxicus]QWL35160.1 hypothetical protein E2R36_09665 [Rathayibacter toxicus]QWL37291.1 hypothetical protein E2R37_09660 [Rathayibacter toxicus]